MARTVLVVDDEETIIQSLNGILTDELMPWLKLKRLCQSSSCWTYGCPG
jgi:hypothetical protein